MLLFALRTIVTGLLTLYLAFLFDLEQPKWSIMAVVVALLAVPDQDGTFLLAVTRVTETLLAVACVRGQPAHRAAGLGVQDNQHVEKGQLLREIDPARYILAVEHARRSVEVAKASLGQSEATIVSSQALLRQRQSEEHRLACISPARYFPLQLNPVVPPTMSTLLLLPPWRCCSSVTAHG